MGQLAITFGSNLDALPAEGPIVCSAQSAGLGTGSELNFRAEGHFRSGSQSRKSNDLGFGPGNTWPLV